MSWRVECSATRWRCCEKIGHNEYLLNLFRKLENCLRFFLHVVYIPLKKPQDTIQGNPGIFGKKTIEVWRLAFVSFSDDL